MPRLRKSYYRRKTIPAWKHSAIVALLSTLTLAMIAGWADEKFKPVMASPLSNKEYVTVEKVVEKKVFETPKNVEDEIRLVFGEHADDALKVLKCENASLNPKAKNDNRPIGGKGFDVGIFQINDHWQGVSNHRFLEDPSINIRIAWNIYKTNGYSFERWTCGRKLMQQGEI